MIFPSIFHILLWGLFLFWGLIAGFTSALADYWLASVCLLVGLSIFDGLTSLKKPAFSLTRIVHTNLPLGTWSTVSLEVSSQESFPLHIRLHDHLDHNMRSRGQPGIFSLSHGRKAIMRYEVHPRKRGHYIFKGADIIVNSPLRLWHKKWFFDNPTEVKVFPNFKEIAHFAILATHHHLSMMGIKKLVRRGEGNEFHQLREYRQGDELHKIDWKATSRYRRLISKEYQDERDQQIIFVLDSGRRMRHAEGGKSILDQALNSILLLSYVASRQGDGVGLYSFGGTEKWLPPRKQEDSVRSLLLGMYDIDSSLRAADYLRAAEELMSLQRRRSLMVIITNSRAEDHEDLMIMTRQLCRKHLVVIADIREQILDETLHTEISGFDDAMRYQALLQYLDERRSLLTKLKHLGVLTLDVTAEQLPSAIVNTYLDIKSSAKL